MPAFHTLPVRDGRGYSAVFSTPLGVTAEMIADQRAVFGPQRPPRRGRGVAVRRGEGRASARPGRSSVWIADRGVLSKPAPEYPLMHEGTADVFAGVPAGVTPRGDEIAVPGRWRTTSSPAARWARASATPAGSSCSARPGPARRAVTCSCSPTTATSTPTPRGWPGTSRASRTSTIAAAVARLHELYEEVGRREERLADLGAKKVTRQLAQQYRDLRPEAGAVLRVPRAVRPPRARRRWPPTWPRRRIKRARKTGIWLGFDTQARRKEAIPPKLVELVSVNVLLLRQDVARQRRIPRRRVVRRGHPRDRAAARPGPRHGAGHGRVRRAVRAAALVLRRGRRRHRVSTLRPR